VFLLSFLQRWWQGRRPRPELPAPYEVPCTCGRTLTGQRQRRHQVVACPACGRKCFILSRTSWPPPLDAAPAAAPPARAPAWPPPLGQLILLVIVGGLAVMGVVFLVLRPYLSRPASPASAEAGPQEVRARIAAGRHALTEGKVRTALEELNRAIDLRDRYPGVLTADEHRRLTQLQRQSDLLDHLLDLPLEEILQQGLHQRDANEWDKKFPDYKGKAVVFDDVLRRDSADRPVLAVYVVRAGDVEARVALEDVRLIRDLLLDPPQRWLFGARLASCRREEGGVWVFRFEPDSGVLLTDPDAAGACCPAPLDEGLRDVLRRQDEWLHR
jgi:hypothetical protein